MPRPRFDPPEMALVRATRQQFESAKREFRIKADTAAAYWKAWEDSRRRLGPAGDPALRRTAEMEMELCRRQAESTAKPAARAYMQAIARAVRAGCASLSGSFSAEDAMKKLLDLEAVGQSLGEEVFLAPGQWAGVLDRVARDAHRWWTVHKDPRGLKLAVMCLTVAEAFDAQRVPGIQSLQAIFDQATR